MTRGRPSPPGRPWRRSRVEAAPLPVPEHYPAEHAGRGDVEGGAERPLGDDPPGAGPEVAGRRREDGPGQPRLQPVVVECAGPPRDLDRPALVRPQVTDGPGREPGLG